ncbi:lipocalin-like domain-containing protein [Streptomyces sp. NPDC048179]|uniref:lipocalin-like domain-containing protein n=1 Tax=Streptomyces sp. NPDC048179 TaxID=3365506 RepID=UPI003718F3C8
MCGAPSRRAFLRGSAAAGVATALPVLGVTACAGETETEAVPASPVPVTPNASAPGGGRTANGYGRTAADYTRTGLTPGTVQQWEDGFRTAGQNDDPDVFEWWYSDFTGDLKTYRMKGQSGDVGVDLTLTSLVRPFRPGTGVIYFGDTDHHFGWLCAVPSGTATGTVTVRGKQRAFTGHGYHDHNWGNRPFPYGVAHWRWGRGSVGPYAVIGADLHLREEYGSATVPVFLVDDTKNGKRLVGAYDTRTVTATESAPVPYDDPAYPRDYYSKVHWAYRDGADRADFTFTDTDRRIVSRQYLTDPTPTQAQRSALDELGIDEIWYTRYATDNDLALALAAVRASGSGTGTLEAAQFGLGDAPPRTGGSASP